MKELTTKDSFSPSLPGIAVVGSGYWGKHLVRNYHDLGALAVICDKNETVLAEFTRSYPQIETCLAFTNVLARADIQGVVVATPAETHFYFAKEALLAGKHVYVEKPLVLNEAEAEQLIGLAKDRSLVLMVGHLLQYHPAFVRLKELISEGELGRMEYIYSHRLNLGKFRREENILWSFAPHDLSMILSLAGDMPESVMATGGNYLHQHIADVTTTHLAFASGLRAHVFVSWLHPFKEQKLVVVGDRKMAVFDDMKPWGEKLLLYPHAITWKDQTPISTKAEPERVIIPQQEPLRVECEHFLECIATGRQPLTDGEEGLRVLRILNASQRSLDQHGGKVSLQVKTPPFSPPQHRPDGVHETAVIDDHVKIGTGTKIWHFSHILSGTTIGERCNLGQNVVVGPDVSIGNGCKIQNNVSVYKGVTLEDDVFCGPSMVFTNVMTPRSALYKMDQMRLTLVKTGASIGANATIVCGATLGRYCFVGAGAVVLQDVPDHALVVGNPAKQVGWRCACGEPLDAHFVCISCGKTYTKAINGLEEQGEV